jgi:hypothetical protein
VKLTQGGRSGELRGVAQISNIDAAGVERADPHGIRVRKVPQCDDDDGDDEDDEDDDDDCDPPAQGPLTLPDDWTGTWQITITARNCQTDQVLAIDEYEDLICPGEVLGEGLFLLFDQCAVDREGDSLQAHCSRSFTSPDCQVRQRLDLELNRQSESLSGQGYWFVVFEGACDGLGTAPCERVVVEGTRVSGDVAACAP